MTRAFLALLLVAAAGCADRASEPETPSAADEASVLHMRGVVAGTIYDGAALRVDHEAVPELGMPAMRMALPLAEPSLADGLSDGDKVALTIEAAPRLRITAVERLPADTPLALATPDSSATDSLASR